MTIEVSNERLILPGKDKSIMDYLFEFSQSDITKSKGQNLFLFGKILNKYLGHDRHVIIPEGTTHIGDGAFSDNETLESISIPQTVVSIGDSAFVRCKKLKEIVLPDSIKYIGKSAFWQCESITKINIPEKITVILEGTFSGCKSLKKVQGIENLMRIEGEAFAQTAIESFAFNGMKIGQGSFRGCHFLKKVLFGKALHSLDNGAFIACDNLETVDFSLATEWSVSIGDSAFSGCKSLREIIGFNNIYEIKSFAFARCHALRKIVICKNENAIKKHGEITLGKYAFEDCSGLTEVNILNSVKYIPEGCFENCTSLHGVYLPECLYRINQRAFYNCTSLRGLTIPDKTWCIDRQAFGIESSNKYWTENKTLDIFVKNNTDTYRYLKDIMKMNVHLI